MRIRNSSEQAGNSSHSDSDMVVLHKDSLYQDSNEQLSSNSAQDRRRRKGLKSSSQEDTGEYLDRVSKVSTGSYDNEDRQAAENLLSLRRAIRSESEEHYQENESQGGYMKKEESTAPDESLYLRHCKNRRTKEEELMKKGEEKTVTSEINPISSITTSESIFVKIPPGMRSIDPLTELKNIAKQEADTLRRIPDNSEETYFSPPVSPSRIRNPFHALKRAVRKEERTRRSTISPEPREKVKRTRRDSFETETTQEEAPRGSEVDDIKFSYNPDTKLFYCPWENCGKFFPSLSRIKRHYIIHTKEKPFKCLNKDCTRRFSRKDNMLQHYRVHCPYAQHRSS